ncbi:MAG TPA: hypothetical protein VJ653_06825, partial [Acidimicrobiales bacterium]|nr:hypothetical protein [Acidimicrobiales bacterium]
LYPEPDRPAVEAALAGAGVEATTVAWDDPGVDWSRFDVAVIRSTWDWVDRPAAYLAWAEATARATALWNPVEAIAWNVDKRYLQALQARGVPVVPTDWLTEDGQWNPPSYEFVVKPAVSAGARETARYPPGDAGAGEHVRRLLGLGHTVMVQPYLAGVDVEGEVKLVFIDGAFSHAVRIGTQLPLGAGVLDRPWERPLPVEPATPTAAQLDCAHQVLAAVDAEVGAPLLYARVDLVPGPAGEPVLAEVELIDPILFLRDAERAADRLVAAIERLNGTF